MSAQYDVPIQMNRLMAIAAVLLLCGVALPLCAGQALPAQAEEEARRQALFDRELELADQAEDRDSRVVHLRTALSCRPDHLDNIVVEFRIGIELSQRFDPEHPQPLRRREALDVFAGITRKYRHADYYRSVPESSALSPHTIVPRAAILAACLERELNGEGPKARDYAVFAMECLRETYQRRVRERLAEPRPEPAPPGYPRDVNSDALYPEMLLENWRIRREAAERGDVLGPNEVELVKAAVRQFGASFGRQRPDEVPLAMGEVIRLFPDTPMARVALGHIERTTEMGTEDLFGDLDFATAHPARDTAESIPAGRDALQVPPSDYPAQALPPKRPQRSAWTWGAMVGGAVLLLVGAWMGLRGRRGHMPIDA